MNAMLLQTRLWYARFARAASRLQHPLLLACRVYWGGLFVTAGYGKLTHLALTAEKFAGWHIPAPWPNAIAAGTTETICGSLLLLGAAAPW